MRLRVCFSGISAERAEGGLTVLRVLSFVEARTTKESTPSWSWGIFFGAYIDTLVALELLVHLVNNSEVGLQFVARYVVFAVKFAAEFFA